MLMIRFQRAGRTNDPSFRIVLLERARAARAGRIVEQLGSYHPKTKTIVLDEVRVKERVAQGAQPTDTVRNLLIKKGILSGKKADSFPASARKKARLAAEARAKEAAAAKMAEEAAAKAAEEAAAAAPTEEEPTAEAATGVSAEAEETVTLERAPETAPAEEKAPPAEPAA